MFKFENKEVAAKYQPKEILGEADPIVHVHIGYDGPLSKLDNVALADKIFTDGAAIEPKGTKPEAEKTTAPVK